MNEQTTSEFTRLISTLNAEQRIRLTEFLLTFQEEPPQKNTDIQQDEAKSKLNSELNGISLYLGRVLGMLDILYYKYFWRDADAVEAGVYPLRDYISAYPEMQTLVDVTLDMTGMMNKNLEEAIATLRTITA